MSDCIVPNGRGWFMNTKYPPDFDKNGSKWDGYPNWNRDALFLIFVVGGYDAEVVYKGNTYYFGSDETGIQQYKTPFNEPFGTLYADGNDFLDNYRFPDGKSIPEVIDELEVELW
ncbi:MAG: hypothetical protein Q4E58_11100 [Prevotellaceae bacterium]|nr:hypothetical protein [Prevotellaceae bacterium]